jgi:hypothetical protein
MANYSEQYGKTNGGYGTPQSQGSQGQQGANQQPEPDSMYAPSRAPMWRPAPASSQSQPKSPAQQTNMGQTSAPGSPVTANGQIAPATQPSQPQGSQQANQQTAGMSTQPAVTGPPLQNTNIPQDPFQAMGGGYWTGQQWVPKNHPLAQQPQGGQPGQPGQGGAPQSPYGPYPARPDGTVYTPGQLNTGVNFQGYNPTQMQQYQGMDFSGIQGQQNQLLSQLLSNPSLSPQVIEQIKARQRESAMAMGGQQQQMAAQNAASRGTNLDSQFTNTQQDINNDVRSNILGNYRDIDIAAAQSARGDQLAALQAAEQVMSGQLGRQGQQFQYGLQGQQAQAGENQYGFESQFKAPGFNRDTAMMQEGLNQAGAASQMGGHQADLGAFFDWQQNLLGNKNADIQSQLGNAGMGLDQQRINNQSSQFGQTHQLNWAQLLNDMSMGRYGLGIDMARLQQQGQDQTMRYLGF